MLVAKDKFRHMIECMKQQNIKPLSVLVLGSMERGCKVFRYQSWESLSLFHELKDSGLSDALPINGFFSSGSFARISRDKDNIFSALMETDSLYAVITDKPIDVLGSSGEKGSSVYGNSGGAAAASAAVNEDVLSASEKAYFCDEDTRVIIDKKDSESAAAGK